MPQDWSCSGNPGLVKRDADDAPLDAGRLRGAPRHAPGWPHFPANTEHGDIALQPAQSRDGDGASAGSATLPGLRRSEWWHRSRAAPLKCGPPQSLSTLVQRAPILEWIGHGAVGDVVMDGHPGKLSLLGLAGSGSGIADAVRLGVDGADDGDLLLGRRREVVVAAARLQEPGVVAEAREEPLRAASISFVLVRLVQLAVLLDVARSAAAFRTRRSRPSRRAAETPPACSATASSLGTD